MRISVAMCTYNGSRFLDEQLSSIHKQLRQPDELVVCDDCSSDDTVQKLQMFARSAGFPVKIVRNETNLGSTRNFEKAISLCDGEIIALSDQDDVWSENRLLETENAFAANPRTGLVFADGDIIDANSAPINLRLWQCANFTAAEQSQFICGDATEVLLKHSVATGATLAFRSEFRPVILPIPEIWVQDGWIALIVSFFANLVPINQPLVRYRQHAQQQIGAANPDFLHQIGLAKMVTRAEFMLRAKQFEFARDRLLQRATSERHKKLAGRIAGLIAHMFARGNMPTRRLRRLSLIFRELATRRYSMYSRGLLSATRDLVVR